MIVVMSTIRVRDGDADALAKQYRERLHLVEDQPGCQGVQILRNQNDRDQFVVYMRWESRESYDRYRASDAYREAHQRISEIAGGIKIDPSSRSVDVYDVLS